MIEKYYNKNDGPTVSSIIESYLLQLKTIVKMINAKQILDFDSEESL